ncbi:MAG: HAD family phosphatase [Clostridia bacterium]|nr:HAD family phosphatase [Clostridia bacterium]
MIKNVIFDFGQVIIHFVPEMMVSPYVTDKDDKALICDVLFDRLYWDKLDKGAITNEEVLEQCHKRLPKRLWAVTDKIYYNWIYNVPEIDGMRELIMKLKEKYNVRLFLLSNISNYFVEHAYEFSIFTLFDKCIYSAPLGIVKPSLEIFDYLCKTCNIEPSEAIFIDDNENNIASAKKFGLNGYIFDGDAKKLEAYLDTIL